jgi:Zn-dependent protease
MGLTTFRSGVSPVPLSFEYLLCSALIAVTLVYGRSLLIVLGHRFRTERGPERVERSDVPADVAGLLEAESAGLEALGFAALAFVREPSPVAGVEQPSWGRLFQHPEEESFALLSLSSRPSRARPCEVTFFAQADAGRRLETAAFIWTDEHASCPKHVSVAANTTSLAEQWGRHQREVAERPDFAPRDVSVDELLVESREAFKCLIKCELAAGHLVPAGEGLVRLSVRTAIARMLAARRRAALWRAVHGKPTPAGAPAPGAPHDVTAEVIEHRRREGVESGRRAGWLLKLGLFAGSLVFATVAFGLTFSLETGAVLIAVLLVHEGGHALAMKAFGYRNMQILFIPLFGAVVSGKEGDVLPWQRLVVLLAGPLPGIVVGSLVLIFAAPQHGTLLWDATLLTLFVNYFNLLPIMPLDGGQIMQLALFERFPRAQVAFSALSGLALMLWSGGTLLFVVGLGMLLSLRSQLTRARVLASVKARLAEREPASEPPDAVPMLYAEMRQPGLDTLNSDARYLMVKDLAQRLARRTASAGLASATVAGWLVLMVAPVGLIRYAPSETHRAADVDEWKTKIAAATTPQQEVRVRLAAVDALYADFAFAEARKQLEPALALCEKLRDPELEASALLWLGRLEQLPPDEDTLPSPESLARAEQPLRRALDLREQRFGVESLEAAEVLEAFPSDSADRVAALVRELRLASIYETALPQHPELRWKLVRAYDREALLRERGGDPERAERALQRALAVAQGAADGERARLEPKALGELSGFYFAAERWDDLRPLLARRAELEPESASDPCWLEYWSGDAAKSGECFAALRAQQAKTAHGEGDAESYELEPLLDEVAAKERAGDRAGAQALLESARASVKARTAQPLEALVRVLSAVPAPDDFAGRERNRRNAERLRLLEPLLAAPSA